MKPQLILEEVVAELGRLADELVFTGGSTVWLYFERPRMGEIRATDDADAVVETASYLTYAKLLERLRGQGISATVDQVGPLCRMRTSRGHILDVMPTRREILGFGNPWFAEAVIRAIPVELGSGAAIRIFPAPLFIASKAAAYFDRGKADPWVSDDLHDILTIMDCRPSLLGEIKAESPALQEALADFALHLLDHPILDELIACHLGASAPGWKARIDAVQQVIESLSSFSTQDRP